MTARSTTWSARNSSSRIPKDCARSLKAGLTLPSFKSWAAPKFNSRKLKEIHMILVTGATGNNGQEIVRLLSRLQIPCRALVRTSEKAGALANLPGVDIAYGDFAQPDSLRPAL